MKPKIDRETQRRLVNWEHIMNYAVLARNKTAHVDEVELVRWTEDALIDIRKSLARYTTRI